LAFCSALLAFWQLADRRRRLPFCQVRRSGFFAFVPPVNGQRKWAYLCDNSQVFCLPRKHLLAPEAAVGRVNGCDDRFGHRQLGRPSAIPLAMFNVSKANMLTNYIPIEYPKWVDGVLVQNAEEEQSHRAMLAEAAEQARAVELNRPPSPAGIRMRRTRERRREGKLSICCDISTDQIEALAMAGFIDPTMRHDPAEVPRGICRSVDQLLSGHGADR
jgi:hypothetical protein